MKKEKTRKGRSREKLLQNNFQCSHSHGSRYCHKHMKECDLQCIESGTCSHCVNYHIPMTQKPCRGCIGLERNKDQWSNS